VIALIAHVRNVDAFVLGRDLGERNQFIGLGMGDSRLDPLESMRWGVSMARLG
jgi:hypothetical protein